MQHDNDELVTIYTAADSIQAQRLSLELESRGIRNVTLNETVQRGAAEVMGLAVDPKIAVARKDEAQALAIAQAFDQAVVEMAEREQKSCGDSGSCGCATSPDSSSEGALAIAKMLDRKSEDETPWPACPNCSEPRLAACPICGTVSGDFPRADLEFSEALPSDSEASFSVICTTCDDPFVPEWLKTCGTCGNNFGEATELSDVMESTEPLEEMNSRIMLVGFLLVGTLVALGAYFMMIGDQ